MRVQLFACLCASVVACSPARWHPHGQATLGDLERLAHENSSDRPSEASIDAARERERAAEVAATPTLVASLVVPGPMAACPADRVEVDGDYCPAVVESCLQWVCGDGTPGCEPNKRWPTGRCGVWQRPTRCLTPADKRPHLHFCIDRYEWPNVEGGTPKSWMSWYDAKEELEAAGKRMCTDVEWTFAAEGPEMHPYPYGDGYRRDRTACNFDKPIPQVNRFSILHPSDPGSEVLEALLVPSGEMDRCVSPFGVHDMAGNIDEWTVNVSGHGKPFVSYLKGGHSLGVRNASRPATEAHGPEFAWWETGTRACLDVAR